MTLNIIVFKNKLLGAFTTPQFDDHKPEDAAIQLGRALTLMASKGQDTSKFAGLVMSCVGTFDDVTGKIENCEPVMLLDCDVAIAAGLQKASTELSKEGA